MERPRVYAAVGLIAVTLLLAGCGNAESPVQPTPPVVTPAPRVFSLSGGVMDTAYRSVGGAKVEVLNGARAGTVATTDEAGRFSMPGSFTAPIIVIASKDEYLSSTRTVPPRPLDLLPPPVEGERWETYFHLEPLGSFVNIAGVYTLTLTADRTCTNLPDEARTRAYTATIVPAYPGARTTFRATLSDARFYSTHNQSMFSTAGDFASFYIAVTEGNTYSWPGIVEQLSETTYVAFEGGGEGLFGASGITAPIDGYFEYCPSETALTSARYECPASVAVQCHSDTHRLSLVRR